LGQAGGGYAVDLDQDYADDRIYVYERE